LFVCFGLCAAIRTTHHKNEQQKSDRKASDRKASERKVPERKTESHQAGENFTESRIKYKFLLHSRTGLNLDAYVVTSDPYETFVLEVTIKKQGIINYWGTS